jgi:hypothetical protein
MNTSAFQGIDRAYRKPAKDRATPRFETVGVRANLNQRSNEGARIIGINVAN